MIPASRSKLVGIGVFNFISCILIHLQQGSKSLDPSESGQNPTCSTCFCFRGHLHMFKHVHVALCQVIGRPSIFLEPYDDWTPNHNFPMVCFSHVFSHVFFQQKPEASWSHPQAHLRSAFNDVQFHTSQRCSRKTQLLPSSSRAPRRSRSSSRNDRQIRAVRIYTSHTTLHILYTVYIYMCVCMCR